ncbi:aminoglycoside phosphotransferase [Prauserella flavalba]|uniref:Aminoglycoside phosphotransferase n=2 Tax=Prauserella flavalba TaxID=1477506 RepID=A0A318LUH3_9PSEU|nr:aminoglycoside phosphotransferase [Prauserella flavalba]
MIVRDATIPGAFAERLGQHEGEAGRRWLARLPALARRYCRAWDLEPDGPVLHGYVGLVVPVRRRGVPAVLKLTWLDTETRDEPVALAAWNGEGAVRLLESDPAEGALLLERLAAGSSLADVSIDEAVNVAGGLLRRLAVPPPPLRRDLRVDAAGWADELPGYWEELGRPLPKRLLDAAVEVCRERGPRRANLMVNEDPHFENVLAGTREPWLVIDPKPIVADVEFGVIPLLWNRRAESPLAERFAAVVAAAELDADLARDWTLVRAVVNWLWAVEEDADDFVLAAVTDIAPWAAGS